MTISPKDATKVLAKCAAFDPMFSKPDRALALGWAEAFSRHQLELDDLLDAVTRHYEESADRAMPVHLIRLAKVVRRERRAADPDAQSRYERMIDAKIAAIEPGERAAPARVERSPAQNAALDMARRFGRTPD